MAPRLEPKATRPYMPGYEGYVDRGKKLLDWKWVVERFTNSHNYLVVTVRRDGRPHAMPVWGLWLEGQFVFSTGTQSRKAKNLGSNTNCVVCTERLEEVVIVEGTVQEVTKARTLRAFQDAYKKKYDWDMEAVEGGIYALQPRVVFGLVENASDDIGPATRWTFEQ